jgi:uncharacterized protein
VRFLVRLASVGIPHEKFLASVRALAKSVGVDARNPKWTSSGALEIDIFSPTRADFDLFLAAVSPVAKVEFSRDLNLAPSHLTEEEAISEAVGYFDSERYWECHEVLEGLWRVKAGDEKSFLQGLILLCAAYVHHQKGEDRVALGVLGRAIPKLEYPSRSYRGLDAAAIRDKAQELASKGTFAAFNLPKHG